MAKKPIAVVWEKVLTKYDGIGSALIPEDIRQDVLALVTYAKTLHKDNMNMAAELNGARQTMAALIILGGGHVDVPYSVVGQVRPEDTVTSEDLTLPDGEGQLTREVKRFTIQGRVTPVFNLPDLAKPRTH